MGIDKKSVPIFYIYCMRAKITLKNIIRFITGYSRWFRYRLLKKHSKVLSFFPVHKVEQIEYRMKVMNSKCLDSGKCVKCGCHTPQLQMIDESCEGNCYPAMMNEAEWKEWKELKKKEFDECVASIKAYDPLKFATELRKVCDEARKIIGLKRRKVKIEKILNRTDKNNKTK